MAAIPEKPKQTSPQRYWKRHNDKQFTVFDRNIGLTMLILIGVFVGGLMVIPQQIEGHVREAVQQTLQRAGLAMLSVKADGQDVYISGRLVSDNFRSDMGKLHAIARGAGCGVAVLGDIVCPAKVYLLLDAVKPVEKTTLKRGKLAQASAPIVSSRAQVHHDFSIEKTADFVTIDGDIPNEKVRDLMLSQATNSSLAVIDNMRITGQRASEYFPWALERAWAILSYLELGTINWREGRFSVDGKITSEHESDIQQAYESGFFREKLAGLNLEVRPVYNDVSTCNQAFTEVFAHETLGFEPQSAKILSSSHGLLDRLTVLAKQCTLSFVVENHTDLSGDQEADLILSQRRAEQVVAALVARGIDKKRLDAVGLGSIRLKKNNNTPIARMQNRRTYIVAKQE